MSYNRLICPMCGNKDSSKIRQEDDLDKGALYHFRDGQKSMYYKRNVCIVCGYEW